MKEVICGWCDEPVVPVEHPVDMIGRAFHPECLFRSLMGSVAHIEKRCSCYVDDALETDPPGMTRRQAAKAALDAYGRIRMAELSGRPS